jgi:hypothetical protein
MVARISPHHKAGSSLHNVIVIGGLSSKLPCLCGSGFSAATIEAESLSHKKQTDWLIP